MNDEAHNGHNEPSRLLGVATPKPGWRSSEFWLAAATTLVGLLVAGGVIGAGAGAEIERVIGLVAAAVASLGYALARSIVKR